MMLYPLNFINLTEETIFYDQSVINHRNIGQCVFHIQRNFDLSINVSKFDKFVLELKTIGQFDMNFYQQTSSPLSFRNCHGIFTKFIDGKLPNSLSIYDASRIFDSKEHYTMNRLYFHQKAEISSDTKTFLHVSPFYLDLHASYKKNNNVTIVPRNLELNSVTQETNDEITTSNLILEYQTYSKFRGIENLSNLYINFSLSKVPFLYIENLQVRNEKLKIHCLNIVSSEQLFVDDMVQNISIDVVCFNHSNVKDFQVVYISDHWQFDSKTRVFDLVLRDRGDHKCFAFEKRQPDPKSPSPKKNLTLFIVLPVSVIVLILLIVVLTFYVIKWHKKHSINSFMSAEISQTDVTQGLL
ncbi:hypothetical protein TVAG_403750 [Trichomonas vaginalis G3]|uniref:Uncharacterized protein n=1 Tax=Trichomonas vaginalis (strain ATCC PRA-98 / G3) TaxID=412133 RepID=A2ELQ3_TRIV3|nr:hypothetical protein TVAGG3_0895020 [Trichomonas vaginalis G3]EAY06418.1 hypothetical protein TVAG_403750 [Trichomonas vaginalis G3]KAI5503006.1 hypothetical protein TVAGG3_0895020 [Trichomonas vaginalis G3]|eukprot:XP_001318641.1 hypothetical protein [Trichomonas vaginalis G3]